MTFPCQDVFFILHHCLTFITHYPLMLTTYGLFMILSRTVTEPTDLDMCTFAKRAFFQSLNISLGFLDLP